MAGPTQVLIVEDTSESAVQLTHAVARSFPAANLALAMNVGSALTQIGRLAELDIAVIDLGLPDGDGHQVIQAARARFPSALLLIYTIFDDDGSLFRALECGADGYLLKHETSETLAHSLRRIVAGEPPLSPRIALRILREFRTADSTPRRVLARETVTYRSESHWALPDRQPDAAAGIRPPAASVSKRPARLTQRELETLRLAAEGHRLPDIALRLGITRTSAATYLKRIYKKISVRNRAQATLEAARLGLVNVHAKRSD